MPRIALVTAQVAQALDEDLPPLHAALAATGAEVHAVAWDDADADWSRFDAALLRSTWDYAMRLPEFLAWIAHAAVHTRLLNPPGVVRWNADKHYLADLAGAGLPCVPSAFVEPGTSAGAALAAFLAAEGAGASEFVVKPAVGAGSRDAQRHARDQRSLASAHIDRLLRAGRSVLLQPYLDRVDTQGETALICFDEVFSHAIRKGPLLHRDQGPTSRLFAPEDITPRSASAAERALAEQALAILPRFTGRGEADARPLPYARVDLIQAPDGTPRLLELELIEPSIFLDHAPGSADRLARLLLARLAKD